MKIYSCEKGSKSYCLLKYLQFDVSLNLHVWRKKHEWKFENQPLFFVILSLLIKAVEMPKALRKLYCSRSIAVSNPFKSNLPSIWSANL